jgi:hypothetical protein
MTLRWNWGTGIALVYSVFALATMGFVVFAMDQKVELVSTDYYQRGLQHDARMAAEANGAGLGDAFRIDTSDGDRAVVVTWSAATPRRGDGTVALYRPSDAAADASARVDPDPSGRQRIAIGEAPPGRWIVRVQWMSGGREYFVERSVTIK